MSANEGRHGKPGGLLAFLGFEKAMTKKSNIEGE